MSPARHQDGDQSQVLACDDILPLQQAGMGTGLLQWRQTEAGAWGRIWTDLLSRASAADLPLLRGGRPC